MGAVGLVYQQHFIMFMQKLCNLRDIRHHPLKRGTCEIHTFDFRVIPQDRLHLLKRDSSRDAKGFYDFRLNIDGLHPNMNTGVEKAFMRVAAGDDPIARAAHRRNRRQDPSC